MTRNGKLLSTGAAIAVLSAAGVGIPQAVGDSPGEQAKGPEAERAKRAALEVVGDGEVVDVERAEGGAGWDVKVVKRGERLGPWWDDTVSQREVEVQLNRDFEWTSARAGDDAADEDTDSDEDTESD
jgi:hypothetical protein